MIRQSTVLLMRLMGFRLRRVINFFVTLYVGYLSVLLAIGLVLTPEEFLRCVGANTALVQFTGLIAGKVIIIIIVLAVAKAAIYVAETLRLAPWQNRGTYRSELPSDAEFLLYLFISKKDSEAVAGDLEERWRKIKKKFGVRRANFWYWTQVIRSLWPFGLAAVKRVSGLLALIEMWRKMRS
jgi:hypothetical protein